MRFRISRICIDSSVQSTVSQTDVVCVKHDLRKTDNPHHLNDYSTTSIAHAVPSSKQRNKSVVFINKMSLDNAKLASYSVQSYGVTIER
jgi:predicted membrane chloride channel (bestrophin family)